MEFTAQDGYIFPPSYTGLSGYINEKKGEISSVYYTNNAYITVAFTATREGEVYVGGIGLKDGQYLNCETNSISTVKTTYAKEGATAKLTVKAVGDGLKYPWYIKGTDQRRNFIDEIGAPKSPDQTVGAFDIP